MGLVSKTVMVKWSRKTKSYYESLGYIYTKMGEEFEVRVKDLPKGSRTEIKYKCDGCGKPLVQSYKYYNNYVKEDGKIYCDVCGKNLAHKGEAFFKSFYDWCIESNRQDVLDRWDYGLNNCSPKDIAYSTTKKYYFKCNIHPEHESELKNINSFTNYSHDGTISCKQCNSIAQYILDNFPGKDLYDVWDKKKNVGINPWKINRGNNLKYWFICQEKDYHGSYEITCANFTSGQRCSYCYNRTIHPKDSLGQYILDNYGEKFLYDVWSDKNHVSPFELSPQTNKKVWWRCPEDKHEDYLRTCNASFRVEFRCPKCVEEINNSIIEEKTKMYLKEIGFCVSTEYRCSIIATNPKTKHFMPYDNEVILSNGKHLIIEVHGEQHYDSRYYRSINKCSDNEAKDMLKQRKLYDRYKKAYAECNGYYYLELPYWSFEGKNKDLYKQIIDNKIKEILEKEEIA